MEVRSNSYLYNNRPGWKATQDTDIVKVRIFRGDTVLVAVRVELNN